MNKILGDMKEYMAILPKEYSKEERDKQQAEELQPRILELRKLIVQKGASISEDTKKLLVDALLRAWSELNKAAKASSGK